MDRRTVGTIGAVLAFPSMQLHGLPTPRTSRRVLTEILIAVFFGATMILLPQLMRTTNGTADIALNALVPNMKPAVVGTGATIKGASASSKTGILSLMQSRIDRALERMKAQGIHGSAADVKPPSAITQPAMNPYNRRAVYLGPPNVKNTDFLDATIESLKKNGGNALVFDVKGSFVYFETDAELPNHYGTVRAKYNVKDVVQKAHDNGLYTIGRFIAVKDNIITSILPETRVYGPKGNLIVEDWIDPSNQKAIDYNMDIMCELAKSGIDEVNMDYIRFSTASFGALAVYSMEEKAVKVEKFIKAARETVDRCGPGTKLGISSYAILGWNYEANVKTLGQDVIRFAPLLDVISPMAYPATFTSDGYYTPGKHPVSRMYWLVYRTLTGYQELLGDEHKHKLRPWIQGYYVDKKDMMDQMQAVYDAGLCGFQVWNANNNYTYTYPGMAAMEPKVPATCI